MNSLAISLPMTTRSFYNETAKLQNRAKMDQIGKQYYNEIKQAEKLCNVPGAILLAVIFTESAGNSYAKSSANAVGLMQLKPQTANDVIFLEHKNARLSQAELMILNKFLGARINGPLKQKYLSHKIKENQFTGNVVTENDLKKPELNILLGAMYLGILIDQSTENQSIRMDKVLIRYNQGYFYKIPQGSPELVLDFTKKRSPEAYNYALKMLGKNGLLETQHIA